MVSYLLFFYEFHVELSSIIWACSSLVFRESSCLKLSGLWLLPKAHYQSSLFIKMSHDTTKPTKWLCAQRRLRSAWASESLLCALWVGKDPNFIQADSKGSDQTGQMPRLIWVFAGSTCHFVGFCRAAAETGKFKISDDCRCVSCGSDWCVDISSRE